MGILNDAKDAVTSTAAKAASRLAASEAPRILKDLDNLVESTAEQVANLEAATIQNTERILADAFSKEALAKALPEIQPFIPKGQAAVATSDQVAPSGAAGAGAKAKDAAGGSVPTSSAGSPSLSPNETRADRPGRPATSRKSSRRQSRRPSRRKPYTLVNHAARGPTGQATAADYVSRSSVPQTGAFGHGNAQVGAAQAGATEAGAVEVNAVEVSVALPSGTGTSPMGSASPKAGAVHPGGIAVVNSTPSSTFKSACESPGSSPESPILHAILTPAPWAGESPVGESPARDSPVGETCLGQSPVGSPVGETGLGQSP
ncbi:hypothetical protein GNI_023480, partial [Gregarina niphandrodes]